MLRGGRLGPSAELHIPDIYENGPHPFDTSPLESKCSAVGAYAVPPGEFPRWWFSERERVLGDNLGQDPTSPSAIRPTSIPCPSMPDWSRLASIHGISEAPAEVAGSIPRVPEIAGVAPFESTS
ncbi:MAG: hypothetical protein SFV15_11675 [Polyangiaceae bacterium]|nr:hypothetical protein [Polyangiaceae bacterium]